MDMKIDGRCHCGCITYEAEIDPEKVLICHCGDCQTLTGSTFRTVALTYEDAFKLLSGELKAYIKRGESGAKQGQTATILLPRMRDTDLFQYCWGRAESPRDPRGHRAPTRRARPEKAALVSLCTALGH